MRFRIADREDLEEIYAFVRDAVKRMEEQGIYQWDEFYPVYDDFAEDAENGQLYVGVQDARLAVVFAVNRECDEAYRNGSWSCSDDGFCVIHRLCVNPTFQNQGVAKKALEYAEKQALQKGFQSVRLDVFSENPFAVRLYTGAGYERVGYADWRKGRFWLMEKGVFDRK